MQKRLGDMRMKHHTDYVRSVAFSTDGKYLASGSDDKTVVVVDVASGETVHTLKHHTTAVNSVASVAFSTDHESVASVSSAAASMPL